MSSFAMSRSLCICVLVLNVLFLAAFGQGPASQLVRPIDETQVITLTGNTHPLTRPEFDEGAVNSETPLNRMVLHLTPSAEQQADLDALVAAQHDPQSPLYHQWLTAVQYGARFGASAQDLAQVTAWLTAHGFTIDEIPASNRAVVFSGTAGQISDTFHTEIHSYRVNGVAHIANAQDPQIPAALAGVVNGVVSLHDFRRVSAITTRRALTAPTPAAAQVVGTRSGAEDLPQYTSGTTNYLFPADWATIYDLNSLYSAGTNGTGTSIAIVGRSNINLSDVSAFRSASGLPANNPTVILVSTNPGLVSGDQDESTLDVEWAGGVAPGTTVKFVVGASTSTTDGVDLSAQYIVNHATAPIVSTSYGSCEQDMGTTELAFYNSLWQQAASQGMSAFVSSGDSGAAGCYGGSSNSASGTGVNGLCSSPYSTCVGGTEFNEGGNNAKYWGTTNSSNYESALSYIPEVVWNESGSNGGSGLWASTGGVSLVYPQPAWQQGLPGTSVANGMRTVPDVAMDAAGHDAYIIVEDGSYYLISGTSAASPSFAGVMALLVEAKGGNGQGNANPGLYSLLNAAHNPFHATPSGNNSVPGVTGFSASGAEYNLATGLGSVDGAVLVSSWGTGGSTSSKDFALTASVSSGTVLAGKTTTFMVSVTESGTAKNAVALTAKAPTGVTVSFSPASITSGATATATIAASATAAAGMQNVTISGSDASGSQTLTYGLTVAQPPTLTLAAAASSVTVPQGSLGTLGFTAATGGSFIGNIGLSISGLPTGVTASWSANPIVPAANTATNSATLMLTVSSTAAPASATISVSATGDGLVVTQNVTLQVQQAAGVQLAASPASVSMQSLATATVTVTATPVGGVTIPTGAAGSILSIASGVPKGFTAVSGAPVVTAAGAVSWILTLTGSSSAAAGSSTLSLTAQVASKAGKTYVFNLSVPVTVTLSPPTLALKPASTSIAVTQGSSVTDIFSLTGNGTYSGATNLSVSGLPSGVTASWSSNPVTLAAGGGSSTLTLVASPTAAAATATVTVTASGEGVSATQQIALQVQPAPGVTLAVSPTSVSMQSLSTATVTVTATPVNGVKASSEKISIVSGLPKGITGAFTAPTTAASGAVVWTLTLTGSASASAESSTLALSAQVTAANTGATYTPTQNVPIAITLTPPSLAIAAASTSLSVTAGSSAVTDLISLAGNPLYAGPTTLSVSGLPTGVTASWSSNPVTLTGESGSSTLTLTASSATAGGSSTITLVATGDSITASKQLTLTVTVPAPTLAVTAASTSMTVINPVEATSASQSSASQVISFAGGGSFKGIVNLSVSGLPPNLTASWSSNPVTLSASNSGSSTLTVTAKSVNQGGGVTTVSPGAYTIFITATGDGLTVVKTVQVQVAGILIAPGATSITIHRNSTGFLAVTTTPVGGASGVAELGLAANASPSGITVQASPASIAAPGGGTTTFTFTVSSTATLRSYQLDVSAALFANSTSTTPLLVGWSSGPVTLNIVQ